MKTSSLLYILRKDRFIVLLALSLICVLSWLYIIYLYNQMYPMNMDALFFAMPMTARWSWTDVVLLFLMWFVMMIAMMTPSVAPLILIFTLINRKRRQQQNPYIPSGYLLSGYFLVWAAFSFIRYTPAVVAATVCFTQPGNGNHQQSAGCCHPDYGRTVPVNCFKKYLLRQLPVTPRFHTSILEGWKSRCASYGNTERCLLFGLLLDINDASFCFRNNEPSLDCHYNLVCSY